MIHGTVDGIHRTGNTISHAKLKAGVLRNVLQVAAVNRSSLRVLHGERVSAVEG